MLDALSMDASTTTTTNTTTGTDGSDKSSISGNNKEETNCVVSRDEIQSALAKAVELRALHAASMQGNSPTRFNNHFPTSTSPVSRSRPLSMVSAQSYPVFTPTYDEEPLPAYSQTIGLQSRPQSGNWDGYGIDAAKKSDQLALWDFKNDDAYSQLAVPHSGFCNLEDQKSIAGSYANGSIMVARSPNAEYIAKSSRRSSLADRNSLSSCNKCKPAVVSTEAENKGKLESRKPEAEVAVPFTDSNLSYQWQTKNRGMNLSWLFPRFKKKQHKKYKSENSYANSPHRGILSEPASQMGSELGMVSLERLKKKLTEAHDSRDAALMEVSEMRSSLGELRHNLEYVESYCEELKRALQQAGHAKDIRVCNQLPKHQNSVPGSDTDRTLPVSEEVLVEWFLKVVSEARSAVKQFCKTLLILVDDNDDTRVDSLNMLLQPYKLSLASKYSKMVLYILEATINQTLYQDFENCIFQKNGSPTHLDPEEQRQAQFSSYLALRNLSWNEVLSKGTKYYSPEFSKFCDQKMSCIISVLNNWARQWPEQLLQHFFVASKCVWLLHLLAFSFNPHLRILRVEENRSFDAHYMDDMFMDRGKARGPSRVKVLVMPGFYVQDRVLRCKVICKYKPTT